MCDHNDEGRDAETTAELSRGRARFETFHRANPEVWKLFERFCLEMIEAGKSDFGAPVVWERIRWEVSLETRGNEPYRLPNIHRPLYARLFQERHPELAHHIATRPLRSLPPEERVEDAGADAG